MPYRAMNVAVAVAGVVMLAGLVLVGANVYRAARTGPRWKRVLISAGLVMLGLVGTTSCTPVITCYKGPPPPEQTVRNHMSSISDRLSSLERQVAQERLQPDAVDAALRSIEEDLEVEVFREMREELDEPHRSELIEMRKTLKARIDTLRAAIRQE